MADGERPHHHVPTHQLIGVEEDDFLAEDAGMVDDVDDLSLGVSVAELVLSEGEGVFLGQVFPQPGEEVKSVAEITEHSTRHLRVVAQLLPTSHFATLF